MKARDIFVIFILVSVVLTLLVSVSGAAWCDNDYAKRINVSVNNTAGSALTDYQIYVNLSANPINETSLRVYNSTGCTLRPHWCENITNENCTKLWINYSSIAASAWTNNTAIYYENAAASSASNGANTFEFFDDFENVVDTFVEVWDSGIIAAGTSDNARNIIIDGNYLYGVSDQTAKLVIYNISNPSSPTQENLTSMPYGGHDIRKSGNYVFISTAEPGNTPGLMIYNVSNVASPSHVTNLNLGGQGHGMFLSGNYLYVCMHVADKFVIVDISNPESPVEKGSLSGTTYFNGAHDVHVDGNYAYVSNYQAAAGQYGFIVVNISDKDNPAVVAYSGNDHSNSHVMKVGNYCYVGAHDDNGMTIYDVSTPTSPVYKGRFFESEGGAVGYWIAVYNSTTLAIHGSSKMHLIDITTPDSPSILRTKSTQGAVSCIDIDGEYFYTSENPNNDWKILSYEFGTDEGLDTDKWTSGGAGSYSIANSEITLTNPKYITSTNTYTGGFATRIRAKAGTDTNGLYWGGFVTTSGSLMSPEQTLSIRYRDSDTYFTGVTGDETDCTLVTYDTLTNTAYHTSNAMRTGTADVFRLDAESEKSGLYPCNVARYIDMHGYTADMIIDWVFVRKYASPEPSSTLGGEEQQGTNPTLHIGNAINIKADWGRDFNSNLSANVTVANASGVWMNFSNAEFTNTSLGNLNLTLNEWVNESHNVNAPVTNVSVDVYLSSTTVSATSDTDSFYYEITKRTNTATMESPSVQNVDVSENFYVNATCNEEYSDTFLGAANLLEDGAIIDTDSSVTNYVNFSHSEGSVGVYNYTIRFYNLTHYDNTTTPTYSNVTVFDVEYIPPDATNLQNTSGNFWVNHTWSMGTPGNITDSYNASIGVAWYNTTTTTYYNDSALSPHAWNNATVWAYNSSGNGSLSSDSVSDNIRIPNNPITVTVTQIYNKLETQTVFISDTSASDLDTDTPTYSCNRTSLFTDFSTVTGHGNWTTTIIDSGVYHIDIGVSDGWGSTDNKTLTITIGDATPGTPSNLANSTGNFWINHTWASGLNTDTFNVSANLSWTNISSNEYYNNTPLSAHKWSNVSVYGFNSTSGELSSDVSQNTQIPNNVPVLSGLPDNTTDEDVNQTDIFDLDSYFTDIDTDMPTYLVESNNQSACVSVTINASNNVSYTLVSGWNGTASIVINATDGWGGEDNDTFLIIVNAAPLPSDYIPDDPTTLQNTTGNFWVNYTWNVGGGNATDSYNVSWNLTWYNTTTDTFMKKEVGASNWANITVYAFNSSGNGSLSAGYISDEVQAPSALPGDYIPANPTTLANTTGTGWVHYTWSSSGGANVTDSYNVSWNLTWYNNTLVAYMNDTVGEFGWANISVWAYNVSGNGSLSAGSISDETQAGGGTFTTSMGTTAFNLITYYGSATSTAEQFGLDIGGVDYIALYNGSFYTHTMGFAANNFTTYHGIGYYVYLNATGSSTYQRNNILDVPYNTQLFNRWNTIGWTNTTNTNAEGVATSIGSACKYTSTLNADGVTYTTHTVGFTSNNHAVEKGKGYWVWVNAGGAWSRNS